MTKKIKLNKKAELSQEFVEEMYKKLTEEKEKLEKELNEFTVPNEHVTDDRDALFPQYGDESDDNAREVADYYTNKNIEETLEKKYVDVKKALERIENGTYGICKFTGKPIGEARLRARPTSSASVEAKKFLTNEI
ncbi:MAG: TraR/DksA family transcriptional regulator [Patescibacteria group bacterium]